MDIHAAFAVTLNGMIGQHATRFDPLTGPEDLVRLRALRTTMDAVLVGANTFRAYQKVHRVDRVKPLLHVIWTQSGDLPWDASLCQQGDHPVWVVTAEAGTRPNSLPAGVSYQQASTPEALVALLASAGINRLLIEGGGQVLQAFLEARLINTIHLTIAAHWWMNGVPLLPQGLPVCVDHWKPLNCETCGDEVYLTYQIVYN